MCAPSSWRPSGGGARARRAAGTARTRSTRSTSRRCVFVLGVLCWGCLVGGSIEPSSPYAHFIVVLLVALPPSLTEIPSALPNSQSHPSPTHPTTQRAAAFLARMHKHLDRNADKFELYLARNIFKAPVRAAAAGASAGEDAMEVDGQGKGKEDEEEGGAVPLPASASEVPPPQDEEAMDNLLTEARVRIRTVRFGLFVCLGWRGRGLDGAFYFACLGSVRFGSAGNGGSYKSAQGATDPTIYPLRMYIHTKQLRRQRKAVEAMQAKAVADLDITQVRWLVC